MKSNAIVSGALGVLLAFGVTVAPSVGAQGESQNENDEARQRLHENLRDIEVALQEIEERASELEIYTMQSGSNFFWESHTYEVSRIEERLEQIGKMIPELQQNPTLEPWQKDIVDEIASLVTAMTAQAEKAIDFLEENYSRTEFTQESYDARVASIYHYAEHLDDLVNRVQGETAARSQRPATESQS